MGLIRLLIFLMIAWLGWRLYKRLSHQNKLRHAAKDNKSEQTSKAMVRCDYCRLHLPQTEAIRYQTLWFCSDEHKTRYLQNKTAEQDHSDPHDRKED